MDRSQKMVLGFLVAAAALILGMRLVAPDSLRDIWNTTAMGTDAILLGLSAFILLLTLGVIRRWRWTFWLLLVAFAFGPIRVAQAVLQLTGVLGTSVPDWYIVVQGLLGMAQIAIAIGLFTTYRRSGPWGMDPLGDD